MPEFPGPEPAGFRRDLLTAAAYGVDRFLYVYGRGILIIRPGPLRGQSQVQALVEKPDAAQARELEETHGPANLLMLEGRARATPAFPDFARTRQHASPGTEPRLAIALGTYAREHPVTAIPVPGDVIDLTERPRTR